MFSSPHIFCCLRGSVRKVNDFCFARCARKKDDTKTKTTTKIRGIDRIYSTILILTMMSLSMPTPTAPSAVATASGYIALLQETDLTLRGHALQKLLECVDSLWHEVAESLPDLEALAEDMDLPVAMRQTAAAVASRVFFHLEESHQALRLALEAGEQHFDPMSQSPYVERLVAAALDAYVAERRKMLGDQEDEKITTTSTTTTTPKEPSTKATAAAAAATTGLPFDQLQAMVHRLLQSSCAHGKYDHALGIALEARETDKVRDILHASGPSTLMLKYALNSAVTVVSSKAFRQETLAVVAECLTTEFENSKEAAYDLILVHQLLKQAPPVAAVLTTLFKGTEQDALLGLQLCFDLMDSGDSAFCKTVAEQFQAAKVEEFNDRWTQAEKVLIGGFPSELALSFLYKQSHADRLIMDNLKKALEERSSGSRSSVLHTAAVVTHSYLYAGTTNDSFLRDFLDWMKKASNWYVFVCCLCVYASYIISWCLHLDRLL
jgi:26S proteasome regulatory subunit N2